MNHFSQIYNWLLLLEFFFLERNFRMFYTKKRFKTIPILFVSNQCGLIALNTH